MGYYAPVQSSDDLIVDILIPARDQAAHLSQLLAALPHAHLRSVVVIDNGSRDATASVARDQGAVVLRESRVGRGAACLRGIQHLASLPIPPDVVVFLHADGNDDPDDIPRLVEPIRHGNAELVVGVRDRRQRKGLERRMVLGMIKTIYGHRFHDLGPMRAIRFPALIALSLTDPSRAFDVEMQVKAIKLGLRIEEVSVTCAADDPRTSARAPRSFETTSRAVFHILRHSTIR